MADRIDYPDESEGRRDPLETTTDATVDGAPLGGGAGLAAGAAIGAVAGGPVGAVIGAAAGALTGVGVAKGVDLVVNQEEEDAYWRSNYGSRPYVTADRGYEYYRPAFRYGWESRARHAGKSYDEVEPDLGRGWNNFRGESTLGWQEAKSATRDAWHRIQRHVAGEADHDRR